MNHPLDHVDHVNAIVVAIPARDEAARVVRCVLSVLTAIDAMNAEHERPLEVSVVVASDGSTDGTDQLLDAMARLEPSVTVVKGQWGSAGGARRAAVDHALAQIAPHGVDASTIWIATTDADTAVPADWLIRHVRLAESGHDALAGIVELSDDDNRTVEVVATFAENYPVGETTHPHVHGANLGVRASAYHAAGGFPEIVVAEDHGLWNELRRHRFRIASPVDLRVFTSARLRSRAPGGFADTIALQLALGTVAS